MFEAEAQQTPMLSPEGIMRAMGEFINAKKQPIPLIEIDAEDLYINKEGGTMEWLHKWHHRDLQEKGYMIKHQEFIMGDVLDLQASIGKGGGIYRRRRSSHKIWEGIRLA